MLLTSGQLHEAFEVFDNDYDISRDELAVAITYALSFSIVLSDLNDYL